MTRRTKPASKTKGGRKRLTVTKRTLKDLSVQRGGGGPKGGFIMKDTIIIPTGHR